MNQQLPALPLGADDDPSNTWEQLDDGVSRVIFRTLDCQGDNEGLYEVMASAVQLADGTIDVRDETLSVFLCDAEKHRGPGTRDHRQPGDSHQHVGRLGAVQ